MTLGSSKFLLFFLFWFFGMVFSAIMAGNDNEIIGNVALIFYFVFLFMGAAQILLYKKPGEK